MDKPKLNPQIQLDQPVEEQSITPMHDPAAADFNAPEGWSKEDISFYFDRALKVLNNDNFTTAKEYIDLLVNQCLAEKHWNDAFTHFLTKLKEMGMEVETDQDKYKTMTDRLFHWRTVRMMIHAAGLGYYEEEILKYEIAKFYQPPPQMLPPARTKEVLVGRTPRRQPAPPKPSIFRPEPKAAAPAAPPRPKPPKPKAGK